MLQITPPTKILFPKMTTPTTETMTSLGLIGFAFLGAGGDKILNNISKNIIISSSGICLGLVSSSIGTGIPAQKECNLKNTSLVLRDTLYLLYAISPYLNQIQLIPTLVFIGLGISSFLCVSIDLAIQYYERKHYENTQNNVIPLLTLSNNVSYNPKKRLNTLAIVVSSNLTGSLAFYAYYFKKKQLASICYILNGSVFVLNIANHRIQRNKENQQTNNQDQNFITVPNILKMSCHCILNIAYLTMKQHPKNKLAAIAEISQAHLLSFQICFNLFQLNKKTNLYNYI